jgi:hypothetical protein
MNSPVESWDLAFGDLAIKDDREIWLHACDFCLRAFSGRPDYFVRWKSRELYRANGGRLISELPADARKKYTEKVL